MATKSVKIASNNGVTMSTQIQNKICHLCMKECESRNDLIQHITTAHDLRHPTIRSSKTPMSKCQTIQSPCAFS